jgi:hypothetical protein
MPRTVADAHGWVQHGTVGGEPAPVLAPWL